MKIRFRVWDGEKMWYPEEHLVDGEEGYTGPEHWWLYQGGQVCTVGHDYNGEVISHYGHAEAMLSTGLKDKNGKEIWAGDICRHRIVGLLDVDSETFQATKYIFPAFGETVEVVGNKYENPELLKEVV